MEGRIDWYFALYICRLAILESIIANLNTLDDCSGGLQAIPLIQVIIMLSTDLNGANERDQRILNDLLNALVNYVGMDSNSNASKVIMLWYWRPNSSLSFILILQIDEREKCQE